MSAAFVSTDGLATRAGGPGGGGADPGDGGLV